jgi:hypothetical protein
MFTIDHQNRAQTSLIKDRIHCCQSNKSRSTGETFPPGPMFSRGEHPSLWPAVGLLRGRNMVLMKQPLILDRLGTLFLVSLTSQCTFAQTQPVSFITSLDWHTLPLALLARPITHTYCQQLVEHYRVPAFHSLFSQLNTVIHYICPNVCYMWNEAKKYVFFLR